jgi:Phage protein (N4 Gp49/phage Sf6 gene 66) family
MSDKIEPLMATSVTLDEIEAIISQEHYFTALDGYVGAHGGLTDPYPDELRKLTFCVLILKNGFTVTGHSACVDLESFDAELGRKAARADAINEVWPLLGYALKERLANKDRPVFQISGDLTEDQLLAFKEVWNKTFADCDIPLNI